MAINDIAVQEFVNAIKEEPQDTNTTYNAVVSRIDSEGVVWVYLQGSEIETPTASTSSEVEAGDNVTVQWRNNKLYIEGNYSNPSAGTATVAPTVNFVTELLEKDISANSISATTGYIGELNAKNVTAEDITADHAMIKELDVESMAVATAYIRDLTADNVTSQDIIADHATIDSLDTTYAHITNGVIDNAKIGYADVNGLNANYAHISNGTIDNAKIDQADVNNLSANYAQINAANVTDLSAQNAWVNKIMVQTGLIAHEGAVYELDAIQVNASKIKAGTLDVDRLIVTVDGEKYLVHIDTSTGTPSYEKLDGGIVEPRTITADKIVAHDITVQEITTENLVGTNGWINLNQGKFFYTTNGSTWANTTNGIMWDGTSLKIKGDVNITAGNVYTKTQTDTALGGKVGNNEVITKINASSEGVQIQASKVDIAGAAVFNNYSTTSQMNTAIGTAVDGIEVGGRNLLLDSEAMSSWYTASGVSISGGVATIVGSSSNWDSNLSTKKYDASLYDGQTTYTWSFEYKSSMACTLVPVIAGTAQSIDSSSWSRTKYIGWTPSFTLPSSGGVWTKYTLNPRTIALSDLTSGSGDVVNGYLQLYCRTDNAILQVRHHKLEVGNKATDWTPAPEDVQAEIDAKKSAFTVNATGTDASQPYATILGWAEDGKPLTWSVDSTDGIKAGDTVRIKTTVSNMSNAPVYVVTTCRETPTSSTSIKTTSHGLDTTIIDGGNILTNSIGANQIKANAITADKLDATTINASNKLTVGSMASAAQDLILNSKVSVGGENLLQQFLIKNAPTDYLAYMIPLTENLILGETYTLQLWGVTFDNTPAGGTVAAYWGGGSIALTSTLTPDSNGYVVTTFTVTQAMYDKNANDRNRWHLNIYNSTPYNSKTARNMTLSRWKLEKGNKATDWSLSSADTKGGINLLRCTADMNTGSGGWAAGNFRYSGTSGGAVSHVTAAGPHLNGINGAVRVTNSNSSTIDRIGFCQDSVPKLTTNKLYTLSGWIRASHVNLRIDFQPIWAANDKTTGGATVGFTNTIWGYFSVTLRLKGDQNSTYSAGYIYAYNVPANGWFEVCGLKLEEGAVATGWTTGMEADASNFISMDSSGIRVASANPSTQNQRLQLTSSEASFYDSNNKKRTSVTSSGLHVFDTDGSTSVAQFGASARVGKSATRHIEIGDGGLQVYQDASTVMAHIGYGSGNSSSGTATAPYFVFGELLNSPTLGNYSVSEGLYNTASGYTSHAEGRQSTASGYTSHAEGYLTTASGQGAHAEGYKTTASGYYDHAEGLETTASGGHSHASGEKTVAGYANQTVIGKYNSNSSSNAFEIGNGTATNARKNAFEVDWNGNVNIASGATYKINGTSVVPTFVKTTFTPTSGSSYSNYGGCYYEKYGRVVHVHVGVSGLTTSTDTTIFTLPSGYRPSSVVFAHGTGGAWNNIGYLEVRANGEVHVRSQGTYCGADVTFMV